nr:GNAT family protein [Pseudomonas luteola]
MLSLIAPTAQDEQDLAYFECTNRVFFESHINARPTAFYAPDGIARAIATAEVEAAQGTAYQFLARDEAGDLVARVNLSRVRRDHFHSAELGYRVAEAHTGRGYASEAVRLVLEQAFGRLRLHRVEAAVRVGNLGSVKVLARNGFIQFGHSSRSFHLAGTWHDVLYFERHRA